MQKTILLTGATDGIGLETAKLLAIEGHQLLIHGRSPSKLETAEKALSELSGDVRIDDYVADLTNFSDVAGLADQIRKNHDRVDVLINNAGVYKVSDPITSDGLDARFVVNTLAPYLLTQHLLPLMGPRGRVVNVSSAAQAPVNLDALAGRIRLDDMGAYAQSKLAITMWSRALAGRHPEGPAMIAVNPGSLLASKMVREGFGVAGSDLGIGADILKRAALSDEFAGASGKYFDNDEGRFAAPHADALNASKSERLIAAIEALLEQLDA